MSSLGYFKQHETVSTNNQRSERENIRENTTDPLYQLGSKHGNLENIHMEHRCRKLE